MKILFSTNSWLYDVALNSYSEWVKSNIEIHYDLIQTLQEDFVKRTCIVKKEKYSLFVEELIAGWDTYNISDTNIQTIETKYRVKLRELMIYDISLVKYAAIPFSKDRNTDYWRRYFVGSVNYYEKLIDRVSPDYVFGEGPHGMSMKVLFEICKKLQIPYYSVYGSYFENKIYFGFGRNGKSVALEYFFNHPENLSDVEQNKAIDAINNVRLKDEMMYFQKNYNKPHKIIPPVNRVLSFLKDLYKYLFRGRDFNSSLRSLIEGVNNNPFSIYFKMRSKKYSNYKYIRSMCQKPDFTENYVVYFAHFQPEASTSVWAPYFENQDNLIENLIKSLPGNLTLYIKEHSTDMGNRGEEFYRNLLYYPSVKLIDPLENSIKLIKNSKMVFTITGTVGLEAIMLKKPVGVFSKCYYSFFEGVKSIDNYNKIADAVKWGTEEFQGNEDSVIRFMASYVKASYDTRIACPNMEDEQFLRNITNKELFVSGFKDFIQDEVQYKWRTNIE